MFRFDRCYSGTFRRTTALLEPVMQIRPLIVETVRMLRAILTARATQYGALLLLPYAGVLIGLDVAAHYGELTHALLPREFFLASDGGFGEWLEYSVCLAVAGMLFMMWRWEGASVHLANAVMFTWLALDNSLQVHEDFGKAFGETFAGWPLPVEPNHIGEAALFVAVGAFWLGAFLLCLRQARMRAAAQSVILAGFIVAAAFFGVIVDLMVVWGEHTPMMLEIETHIEDGGEFLMLCLAFLATVAMFDLEMRRRSESRDAALHASPLTATSEPAAGLQTAR